MQIAGIICEFNPFHNGHRHIIEKIRRDNDCIIGIMSGNYVERGEPALISKYERCRMALECGVDLIIELPSPWSASYAENFAIGGVSILKECGADRIYFGSECGELSLLEKIANADISTKIKPAPNETFAVARARILGEQLGKQAEEVLNGSNDNLAIEYLKAIKRLGFQGEAIPIKRIGAEHDSDSAYLGICSASHIRANIEDSSIFTFMPKAAAKILEGCINKGEILDKEKFQIAVISYLRRADSFENLPELSEGLENKLLKEIKTASSLSELINSIKSKRYTHARIRRLILSAFLNQDKSAEKAEVPYLNILGFTETGELALKKTASSSSKALVFAGKPSKPLTPFGEQLLKSEEKRNDIYASLLKSPLPCGLDRTKGVIKI